MTKPERWRPIRSHEHYEISDLGRVRTGGNTEYPKVLTPMIRPDGRKYIRLIKRALDGSTFRTTVPVVRLVATAFWPEDVKAKYVRFIDEDPGNCALSNLRPVDRQDGVTTPLKQRRKNYTRTREVPQDDTTFTADKRRKLSPRDRQEIYDSYTTDRGRKGRYTLAALAEKYGVSVSTIRSIANPKIFK